MHTAMGFRQNANFAVIVLILIEFRLNLWK